MSQHKVSYALAYVTSFSRAHIKKKKEKKITNHVHIWFITYKAVSHIHIKEAPYLVYTNK